MWLNFLDQKPVKINYFFTIKKNIKDIPKIYKIYPNYLFVPSCIFDMKISAHIVFDGITQECLIETNQKQIYDYFNAKI